MKTLKTIVLVIFLTMFTNYQCVNAQGKESEGVKKAKEKIKGANKDGQERIKEVKNKVNNASDKGRQNVKSQVKGAKENAENRGEQMKNKAIDNGKNAVKDKAYGQARANEIKEKLTKQTANFEAKDKIVSSGRERISAAKAKLEILKKEGKLTKEEISAKQAKISKAELQLEKLNKSLIKGKAHRRLIKISTLQKIHILENST